MEKEITTKICPKCGTDKLLRLPSHNKKICVDCNLDIPWYLDKDQKPLH